VASVEATAVLLCLPGERPSPVQVENGDREEADVS